MADNNFVLKIITPDRVFFHGAVSMVEFNTVEGEVGIYRSHVPMTMIAAPGILTITCEDGIKNAALHAGFAEVLPEQVTILAEVVEWPGEIDANRAQEARKRAEERLKNPSQDIDIQRAELALRRALTRIEAQKA